MGDDTRPDYQKHFGGSSRAETSTGKAIPINLPPWKGNVVVTPGARFAVEDPDDPEGIDTVTIELDCESKLMAYGVVFNSARTADTERFIKKLETLIELLIKDT